MNLINNHAIKGSYVVLVNASHDLLSNLMSHTHTRTHVNVIFTAHRVTFDAYALFFYYSPIQHVAMITSFGAVEIGVTRVSTKDRVFICIFVRFKWKLCI